MAERRKHLSRTEARAEIRKSMKKNVRPWPMGLELNVARVKTVAAAEWSFERFYDQVRQFAGGFHGSRKCQGGGIQELRPRHQLVCFQVKSSHYRPVSSQLLGNLVNACQGCWSGFNQAEFFVGRVAIPAAEHITIRARQAPGEGQGKTLRHPTQVGT